MAEPGYDFTKETAERIVRAVRKIEALPPTRRELGAGPFSEKSILFRNDSSTPVPGFGVAAIVGTTHFNDFPLLIISQPTSLVAPAYLVNSHIPIASSAHGQGYAAGIVAVQYTTPPTTNYETYGPTSGSWALSPASTIPLAKAIGVWRSSDIIGFTTGPVMQAYWLSPSTAVDEKLAASSENNGMYASTLFTPYNATTDYRSGKDAAVDFEPVGTTPNQSVRGYIDTDAIPGYNAGLRQFLIKDSSDNLAWTTITEGSAATDEKLAASSENDGVYWGGLHADFNATTIFNTTADFKVESEIIGTTPNQDIQLYVDASDIFNYDAAYHQFCMHNASSGGLKWSRWEPAITSSGVYNSSNDIKVSAELDASVELRPFIDASAISGYSTAQQQYLGHNASGLVTWSTNADGAAGTDEKLAATSENNGAFWDALHNEYNASTILTTGKDFLVESEVSGTTPAQKLRLYVDASDIAGFVTGVRQFLSHDTGDILTWVNATTCT